MIVWPTLLPAFLGRGWLRSALHAAGRAPSGANQGSAGFAGAEGSVHHCEARLIWGLRWRLPRSETTAKPIGSAKHAQREARSPRESLT